MREREKVKNNRLKEEWREGKRKRKEKRERRKGEKRRREKVRETGWGARGGKEGVKERTEWTVAERWFLELSPFTES